MGVWKLRNFECFASPFGVVPGQDWRMRIDETLFLNSRLRVRPCLSLVSKHTSKKVLMFFLRVSRRRTIAAIASVRARRCEWSRRYSVERACFCMGYTYQTDVRFSQFNYEKLNEPRGHKHLKSVFARRH